MSRFHVRGLRIGPLRKKKKWGERQRLDGALDRGDGQFDFGDIPEMGCEERKMAINQQAYQILAQGSRAILRNLRSETSTCGVA
jgi:hypothetical protein